MDAQQVRKFVVKRNVRSGLDRLDMKTRILLISKESRFSCALQGVWKWFIKTTNQGCVALKLQCTAAGSMQYDAAQLQSTYFVLQCAAHLPYLYCTDTVHQLYQPYLYCAAYCIISRLVIPVSHCVLYVNEAAVIHKGHRPAVRCTHMRSSWSACSLM
jgi:hypothetical protein